MTNNDTSVNHGNGVRIVCVATLLLARQNLSNCRLPDSSVDVISMNDGLYGVGIHLPGIGSGQAAAGSTSRSNCPCHMYGIRAHVINVGVAGYSRARAHALAAWPYQIDIRYTVSGYPC